MGRDGDHDDDTAVLALLLTTAPDLELRLATEASSARTARHAVRALLAQAGVDTDVAALLVTELVANTARYAGEGSIDVRATLRGETVRIEVDDDSGDLPGDQREPRWEQESGRGLLLVEALSERWGVELLPTGKRVVRGHARTHLRSVGQKPLASRRPPVTVVLDRELVGTVTLRIADLICAAVAVGRVAA